MYPCWLLVGQALLVLTVPVRAQGGTASALAALSAAHPVHIFYYAWFGAPGFYDGGPSSYREWDHDVLAHWDEREKGKHSSGNLHEPPEDIASAFYPSRGLYSSLDAEVVQDQMQEIAEAGVDVVIFSWWRNMTHSDIQGRRGLFPGTDGAALAALDGAAAAGVKVCFHLEPYNGRTVANVRDDIEFLLTKYRAHPGLLLVNELPVFYIYDSYHLPIESWKELLLPNGKQTVRGTPLDGIYIGLYLSRGNERYASEGGFDGLYTYFAATSFSDGTRLAEWPRLIAWANQVRRQP
jgi:glycoprotein endo-alpha-1,2-mannosidase